MSAIVKNVRSQKQTYHAYRPEYWRSPKPPPLAHARHTTSISSPPAPSLTSRRLFYIDTKQHGTEDCPSSDTLLLAWALMESKIHNARARKTAWALLRRAVALNPKKHSKVLKWTMFTRDLDWVEAAGGAAVQAMRSVLSPAPAPAGESTSVRNGTAARRCKASTSRAEAKRETEIATELQALCHSNEALLREQEVQGTRESGGKAADNHQRTTPPLSPHGGMPVPAASPTSTASSLAPSARFRELAGELEKNGAGAEGGVRALSGTWRLVFTTCKECDRVLVRTGAFYFTDSSARSIVGCFLPA